MDSPQTKQDFWNEHIRAWRSSGLTQGEYCNRHGLKVASLGYWLGKQRRQAEPLTLVPLPLQTSHAGPVLHGATGWRLELPVQIEAVWLADLLARLP